ncbi:hypothetical protein M0811_10920 [Anaeramoeba ignava]|uniref:Uncharacterized protein n=1 Tax=Anaeramoeba ignava TaxID=1746090 RepID=A0A9Q0LFA7_ANAIG|nr:hypothetical protein M0811_10920 [Anaeramoeba ignava]
MIDFSFQFLSPDSIPKLFNLYGLSKESIHSIIKFTQKNSQIFDNLESNQLNMIILKLNLWKKMGFIKKENETLISNQSKIQNIKIQNEQFDLNIFLNLKTKQDDLITSITNININSEFIEQFSKLLKNQIFLNNFLENSLYSLPLLSRLFSFSLENQDYSQMILEIFKSIQSSINNYIIGTKSNQNLINTYQLVISSYINNISQKYPKNAKKTKTTKSRKLELSANKGIKLLADNPSHFEKFLLKLTQEEKLTEIQIQQIILSIFHQNMKNEQNLTPKLQKDYSKFPKGILFDYYELFQRSGIYPTLEQMKDLLSFENPQIYYLITFIVSNSDLNFLQKLLIFLLNENPKISQIQAKNLLDIVHLMIRKFKSIGNEYFESKIDPQNIISLTNWILYESESTSQQKIQDNRIQLLLSASESQSIFIPVIYSLINRNQSNFTKKKKMKEKQIIEEKTTINPTKQLLLRLYFEYPERFIAFQTKNQLFNSVNYLPFATQISSSGLDESLYKYLRCLTSISQSNKGYTKLCYLALNHPLIVYRFIPNFFSLIEGKIYIEFPGFLDQNYHRLFSYIVGILLLLKPFVFHHEKTEFIVEMFLEFIKSTKLKEKKLISLFSKIITFLCYCGLAKKRYRKKIQSYSRYITRFHEKYFELKKVQLLLDIISKKSSNQINEDDFRSFQSEESFEQFKSRLDPNSNTYEQIEDALKELDAGTIQLPNILELFIQELLFLTQIQNQNVPMLSYKLIKRCLIVSPKYSTCSLVMRSSLQRLSNSSKLIRQNSLQFIPQLILFCPNDLFSLLFNRLFNLKNESTEVIKEILFGEIFEDQKEKEKQQQQEIIPFIPEFK